VNINNLITIAAGLLLAGGVSAAVYKTVDEQGNVVYTDEPVGNGEPIKLPPLSTVPPPKYMASPASGKPSEDAGGEAAGYEGLAIVAPIQDETLRDNTGNVVVRVSIKPDLNKPAGHRLQYFLDGQKHGELSAADQAIFPNVDRGAHTAEVAIVDAMGKELKRSASVRFHLHRQSTNFPRGPGNPTPLGSR
jgi:hypothetical protein